MSFSVTRPRSEIVLARFRGDCLLSRFRIEWFPSTGRLGFGGSELLRCFCCPGGLGSIGYRLGLGRPRRRLRRRPPLRTCTRCRDGRASLLLSSCVCLGTSSFDVVVTISSPLLTGHCDRGGGMM